MKLKSLSLIAGAIALTLTATTFVVQAQDSSPSPLPGVDAQHKEWGPWQKLNLTADQKNQIKQIHASTRSQIEAILTPDQLAKLQAQQQARQERRQQRMAQGQGQSPQGQHPHGKRKHQGGPFADLNLTANQKAQIKQIMESSKQQFQAVLTPQQQQQLKQFQQNHRSHRQQNSN